MPKNDDPVRRDSDPAVHLCVDMQRMFAEGTEWNMPWLERVLPNIASITSAHPERTIFTRFIRARDPAKGSVCGSTIMSGGDQLPSTTWALK